MTNTERRDWARPRRALLASLACCGIALAGLAARSSGRLVQAPTVLAIDAAGSRVVINVGRTGLLSFAGHDHEVLAPSVRGSVTFVPDDWQRSSVALEFDASALKVTGKGDPPADVPAVQRVMLSAEVLDTGKFPIVAFRSSRVSATPRTSGIELVIEGNLTLHGVTRPTTIRAVATPDAEGLTARGGFTLKQTDFGMKPVTAAGGTVRVKDEIAIQFVFKARRSG